MELKKLNLGCGTDIREGWVNLDSSKLPGVDVVHDLEKLPLPFKDGEFGEIVCQDVLEHLDYVPTLKEIHRILAPGGKVHIRVPHFTSKNNFTDPTHKKMFAFRTFSFFTEDAPKGRAYYFQFAFKKIESVRITFERSSRMFFFNALVESLANRSYRMKYMYESTFLSRLFPAENLLVTLVK